jgi:putative flippase GtrA
MPDRRPLDYRSFRHWGGFIFSGGSAFVVDAGINTALIHLFAVSPFVSRLISIGCAMVFAWLMHRRVTFAIAAPPSFAEFLRFATVAGSANALNYAVYATILVVWPSTPPLAALVISTAIATAASYLGFRFGVFRQPND